MIGIPNGVATWDWQLGRWWTRVDGVEAVYPTLDDMAAVVDLDDDLMAELIAYKNHQEEFARG